MRVIVNAAGSFGVTAIAWYAIVALWATAAAHLDHLMGMGGGDVGGPWVVMIAGGILAVGLASLAFAAHLRGAWALVLGGAGVGLAAWGEWHFASYLDRLKRFISPEYDRLPGPRPTQLVTDVEYHSIAAWVITGHILETALVLAATFFAVRWIATSR